MLWKTFSFCVVWLATCSSSLWDWWLVLRITDCRELSSKPSLCSRLCASLYLGVCGSSVECVTHMLNQSYLLFAALWLVRPEWVAQSVLQGGLSHCKYHMQMSLKKYLHLDSCSLQLLLSLGDAGRPIVAVLQLAGRSHLVCSFQMG